MICKFLKQNVLFPKGLNWVKHSVSRFGLRMLIYLWRHMTHARACCFKQTHRTLITPHQLIIFSVSPKYLPPRLHVATLFSDRRLFDGGLLQEPLVGHPLEYQRRCVDRSCFAPPLFSGLVYLSVFLSASGRRVELERNWPKLNTSVNVQSQKLRKEKALLWRWSIEMITYLQWIFYIHELRKWNEVLSLCNSVLSKKIQNEFLTAMTILNGLIINHDDNCPVAASEMMIPWWWHRSVKAWIKGFKKRFKVSLDFYSSRW